MAKIYMHVVGVVKSLCLVAGKTAQDFNAQDIANTRYAMAKIQTHG